MPKSSKKTPLIETIKPGDEAWKALRRRYTQSIPGRYSSLYFLVNEVLGGLGPSIPMTYRAHWPLCLFVEGMTGIPEIDNARVKMLMYPRGVGKTAIATRGLATKRLLIHDDYALAIGNETQMMADKILGQIKIQWQTNDTLRALWPERVPPNFNDTTWKASQIVLPRKTGRGDPSALSAGVGANITGAHFDEWFLDDLLSRAAAEAASKGNFGEIESTNYWVTTLEPLLVFPKRSPIIVCATYWWEGDTYCWMEGFGDDAGHWGHGEEVQRYTWRVKLPDGESLVLELRRKGEIAVFARGIYDETGESWCPEIVTNDELELIRQQDPAFFASQYLLKPTAGGAADFQLSWLRPYSMDGPYALRFRSREDRPEFARVADLTTMISVDPAFSDSSSAARTAIPVVGVHGDNIFLLEDFAERGMGLHDTIAKVMEFTQRYKPTKIFLETIVGQVLFAEPLRRALRDAGFPYVQIVEIPSHGHTRKTARIYGLDPFFRSGRFFYRPDQRHFIQEYQGFSRSALRDVLDALSFQKDEWEKLAYMAAPLTQRAGTVRNPWAEAEAGAIARLRNAARRH